MRQLSGPNIVPLTWFCIYDLDKLAFHSSLRRWTLSTSLYQNVLVQTRQATSSLDLKAKMSDYGTE